MLHAKQIMACQLGENFPLFGGRQEDPERALWKPQNEKVFQEIAQSLSGSHVPADFPTM